MKIIRTAFLFSTGFSVGAVYTLRHSTEIVDAIGDLRDEVVKAFSEQEDPEPLKTLLEQPRFAEKDDDEILWATGDMDSEFRFTVGDLRALSVHHEPTPAEVINAEFRAWDGIDRETRRAFTNAIEKMRDAPDEYPAMVANQEGDPLITMGQLRTIHKAIWPDNNETPKENTSP